MKSTEKISSLKMAAFIIPLLFINLIVTSGYSRSSPPKTADWTIMIFMNGDNNLNDAALEDFMEMSKVGSTEKVNIIVQFDRLGDETTGIYWSQTLRFRITKNMFPLPENKIEDIGEANMGDGKVLSNFVTWSMNKYPANHFMLIIWDHGQGWRLTTRFDSGPTSTDPQRSSSGSPYKSVSYDETDSSELYNREIQDSLSIILKEKKLDILGFDACLMAMAETGYSFRNLAEILVGSEELEPGTGWQYDDWLKKLTGNSSVDAKRLSGVLVESYKKRYYKRSRTFEPDHTTTLSAINLSRVEDVAEEVDRLAVLLIDKLSTQLSNIISFRNKCDRYAPNEKDPFYHIDITRFCDVIIADSKDQLLVAQAKLTRQAVLNSIISNYRGTARGGKYGSFGMAIYFPPNAKSYKEDIYARNGYEKENTDFPVEFVQKFKWANFLHAYFKLVP